MASILLGLAVLFVAFGSDVTAGASSPLQQQLDPNTNIFAAAEHANVRELGAEGSPLNDAYMSTYEIVATWPHDPKAFTQGLAFDRKNGNLYESDGLYHQSGVRKVDVATGQGALIKNPTGHFGEGLEIVGNKMYQLTWKENKVHEFKLSGPSGTIEHVKEHQAPCAPSCKEGWGLAYDAASHKLYQTDSTDKLFTLDPDTLKPVGEPRQIFDSRLGRRVNGVNELEWVDGELWGNVYPMYQGEASECIVRINATDATVLGWIDMRGLLTKQRDAVKRSPKNLVLNGIAYHPTSGRLYVTGKQWDKMYQVRIVPAEREAQTASYVNANCHLGRDTNRVG